MRFSGSNAHGHRWPLRRNKGADCRLLDLAGASLEEAIEWVKRSPNPHPQDTEVEIRQIFEAEDFGAEFTPELRQQEERLRSEMKQKP